MARQKQHRDSPLGDSQRQLRVGELVRHALADMLTRGDVHDPVIERHMITIPEVRVTADLRLATIVNGDCACTTHVPLAESSTEKPPPLRRTARAGANTSKQGAST